MKDVTIYLILLTFYWVYTSGDRISLTKCRQYSRIPTNVSIAHPHLAEILYEKNGATGTYRAIGTLISDQFVFTMALPNLIIDRSHVQFRFEPQFNIIERHTHPLYDMAGNNNLGLLKLDRTIQLNSLHRPACLWSEEYSVSATVEVIKTDSNIQSGNIGVETFNVISGADCKIFYTKYNESVVCMTQSDPEVYHSALYTSPIQSLQFNSDLRYNYYIYCIFLHLYGVEGQLKLIATKLNLNLDWIESHVWPTTPLPSISIKSNAERISVTKCREYSRILKDSHSPHLVYIYSIAVGADSFIGLGSLISEKFVITTVIPNLIVHRSFALIEHYDHYTIVEQHIHPFFGETPHHSLTLLKLEYPIRLDSKHRPACLWASAHFELTTVQVVKFTYTTQPRLTDIRWLNVVTGQECTILYTHHNESLICLKPTNTEDSQFLPSFGSPIQINKPEPGLPDRSYIYGIFTAYYNTNPYTSIGTKISTHLDWIESHVWPADADGCGNVGSHFRSSNPSVTIAGEFPWHTAIYQLEGVRNRNYKCDGTLLNELTVVTASDCVPNPFKTGVAGLLVVVLGLYNFEIMSNDRQEKLVDRITMKYNDDNVLHENHLAILKLRSAVTYTNFVQPICLTSKELLWNNPVGIIAGWGKRNFNMRASRLSKGFVSLQNQTNDGHFNAVYQNGTGACSGGLGGGLIVEFDGRWFLKGIMVGGGSSADQNNCDPSEIIMFTDAVKWHSWITK